MRRSARAILVIRDMAEEVVDEFAAPITTGMQLVSRDETANDELSSRLDEFDAVRNRGAVEASVTPWPTKRPHGEGKWTLA